MHTHKTQHTACTTHNTQHARAQHTTCTTHTQHTAHTQHTQHTVLQFDGTQRYHGTFLHPNCRSTPTVVDSLAGKQLRSIQCGGSHMACAIMHTWVPDEEAKGCMACKKQFTTFYRRVCVCARARARVRVCACGMVCVCVIYASVSYKPIIDHITPILC